MNPAIFVDSESLEHTSYVKFLLSAHNVSMDIYIIFYDNEIIFDNVYCDGKYTLKDLMDLGFNVITADTLLSKYPQSGREFQSITSSLGKKEILQNFFNLKPTTYIDENDLISHEGSSIFRNTKKPRL